jgi:hypothetical protein
MDEPFQERPALFFDFMAPFGSKDLLANLWIADPTSQLRRLHQPFLEMVVFSTHTAAETFAAL